jgi:hypothetical protein
MKACKASSIMRKGEKRKEKEEEEEREETEQEESKGNRRKFSFTEPSTGPQVNDKPSCLGTHLQSHPSNQPLQC